MTNNSIEELQRVARDLQHALDEFRSDARLTQLAQQDVPDAKLRLEHVLKLTDDAAHRTLDLVEQSVPIADRTALLLKSAPELTGSAKTTAGLEMDQLRSNLTEMLLAQGYQDLSGQILRGVMKLVGEIEMVLARLVAVTGNTESRTPLAVNANRASVVGPAVPGVTQGSVVGAQGDVDDLLSGMGL